MKIQKTLLWAGLLVWSTCASAAKPNLIIDAGGQMRVRLNIPTQKDVDLTTPVTMGRIEIAPVVFVPGFLGRFTLNHLSLSFADFDIVRGEPFGSHHFRSVGVNLRDAVDIVAGEVQPNVYAFTLLRDDITFYGATLVNGELHQGDERPSQDVTGTIDLANNTFNAKVVIVKHDDILGFDVGGPLTITITGMIAPGSDTDGDGVQDTDDNCVLTANPRIREGLGQYEQPPVASPVVTPPADVRAITCTNVRPGDGIAVDICDGLWTKLAHDAPPTFGVGTTTVTWTASTIAERVATATQTVTVTDQTLPRFQSVPPPITFPQCIPRPIGVARATDDCDAAPVVKNNAPVRFPIGRTIVTWTATDRSGNRATATQAVTVTTCTIDP